MTVDAINLSLFFIASLLIMTSANYLYIKYARDRGLTAPDVQKKGYPQVPKWGGLTLPISFPIFLASGLLLDKKLPNAFNYSLALILAASIGYFVGVLDDLKIKKWDLLKIASVSLAAVPIILLKTYSPRPFIPFVGNTRLTLIYPLLLFVAFAVVPNGMNMLDLVNGVMLFSQITLTITLIIWSFILGNTVSLYLSVIYLAVLISYYIFNRYPAKLFVSNVGSYATGTITVALIVFSRLEYISIIALLPMILNSFSLLSTMKKLLTREEIKETIGVINYSKDGVMYTVDRVDVPININRMILLHGPLEEKYVVKVINWLFIISTILANITAYVAYILL